MHPPPFPPFPSPAERGGAHYESSGITKQYSDYYSSSTQIWLIICKFANYPPFIGSLFCGSRKTDNSEEFLRDFLHEFDVLRETGFQNGNNVFLFNLHAFVCDAPARQFLKCVKSHTG